MSKIDIRFRRQQFTHGRIQQHKNYESLLERHKRSHRRKVRGIVLIAFILLLALMWVLSFFKDSKTAGIDKKLQNQEVYHSGARDAGFF